MLALTARGLLIGKWGSRGGRPFFLLAVPLPHLSQLRPRRKKGPSLVWFPREVGVGGSLVLGGRGARSPLSLRGPRLVLSPP